MQQGERAYVYAKASGIIGKSFIGKRTGNLKSAGRVSELDRMVFPVSPGNLPEKELLIDFERRVIGRAVHSIISIVSCFSKPPEFAVQLIRSYEYLDLINAINALIAGENERKKALLFYTDIGSFQTVRFNAWPDIKAMIEKTAYDFLLRDNVLKISGGKVQRSAY